MQAVAHGKGSTAPKKEAEQIILDGCGYCSGDADVEQVSDGAMVKRPIKELEQTLAVKQVVKELETAAITSVGTSLTRVAAVYMHPNFDHASQHDSEPTLLLHPKIDWSSLQNLHNKIAKHISGVKPLNVSNMREVVNLCKSSSASSLYFVVQFAVCLFVDAGKQAIVQGCHS